MDSYTNAHCGPVMDLVDPYSTKDTATATVEGVAAWMRSHPGRWAMFAEGDMGVDRKNIQAAGDFEVCLRTSKTTGISRSYARLPHPEGETLNDALARTAKRPEFPPDLPDLQQDSFNWTKEELEAACAAARESLFPVQTTTSRRRT